MAAEEGQPRFKLLGVDFKAISRAALAVMHQEQCPAAAASSLACFMGPDKFWEVLFNLIDSVLQNIVLMGFLFFVSVPEEV